MAHWRAFVMHYQTRRQRKLEIREWHGRVYKPSEDTSYLHSHEWRVVRRMVIMRDHQRCQRCDKRFKIAELTAHHLIPRAEGGTNHISNLVTLCNPCHDFVEISGYRTLAEIMGSYDDGTKTDQPSPEPDEERETNWRLWVYGGQKHLRRP